MSRVSLYKSFFNVIYVNFLYSTDADEWPAKGERRRVPRPGEPHQMPAVPQVLPNDRRAQRPHGDVQAGPGRRRRGRDAERRLPDALADRLRGPVPLQPVHHVLRQQGPTREARTSPLAQRPSGEYRTRKILSFGVLRVGVVSVVRQCFLVLHAIDSSI